MLLIEVFRMVSFSYHVFVAYSPEGKAGLSVIICKPVLEAERSVPLAADAPFAI